MTTLRDCLLRLGLAEHEAAILRGAAEEYRADGESAQRAAELAVRDRMAEFIDHRDNVTRQIREQGGYAPEAPDEVSAAQREGKPEGEAAPQRDLFSQSPIPGTEAFFPEKVIVELEEIRKFRLPEGKIETPFEAAQAFLQMVKSPRELFQMIVLDKDQRPIAAFELFAGSLTQTSVYPREVITAAHMVDGAKSIWVAHNHPSGVPQPSRSDQLLTQRLAEGFDEGMGIDFAGHVVLAGDQAVSLDRFGEPTDHFQVREPQLGYTEIPVLERKITFEDWQNRDELTEPNLVRAFIEDMDFKTAGFIMLDARHRVIGWWPMPEWRGGRFKVEAQELFRKVGRSNPAAMFLYMPSLEDGSLSSAKVEIERVKDYLKLLDVKLLDAFLKEPSDTLWSFAERGLMDSAKGVYFSLRPQFGGGMSVEELKAELRADPLAASMGDRVHVITSPHELPKPIIAEAMRRGGLEDIEGAVDPDTGDIYLIAAHATPGSARVTMLHEAVGHFGFFNVLSEETRQDFRDALADIYRSRRAQIDHEVRHGALRDYNLDTTQEYDRWVATAEWIAREAEAGREQSMWRRFVAKVRAILRKLGFVREWTDNDILRLLQRSRESLAQKGMARAAGSGARLSLANTSIWYSPMAAQIAAKGPGKATGEVWRQFIEKQPGISKEEIEWSGILDYLRARDVTFRKDDVLEYIADNGVKVKETMLGAPERRSTTSDKVDSLMEQWRNLLVSLDAGGFGVVTMADIEPDAGFSGPLDVIGFHQRSSNETYPAPWLSADATPNIIARMRDRLVNVQPFDTVPPRVKQIMRQVQQIRNELDAIGEAAVRAASRITRDRAVYGQWTLPGGQNYRELLLTLPTTLVSDMSPEWKGAVDLEFDARTGEPAYRSAHFDQMNVLAHVRFNDRVDNDAKRVLFIEEIQSDWAEEGRKYGFKDLAERAAVKEELAKQGFELTEDTSLSDLEAAGVTPEIADRWWKIFMGKKITPPGPYLERTSSWVSLVMRRMIKYAAENGYERVAWTTGDQQNERYNLERVYTQAQLIDNASTGIQEAELRGPFERGVLTLYSQTDGPREVQIRSPDELKNILGDELAAELLGAPAERARLAGIGVRRRKLIGFERRMGGEPMRAFYDKMLPNIANDVLKKLGAKTRVGQTELNVRWDLLGLAEEDQGEWVGLTQPSFDITPELQERARRPMPLFQRRNPGGAGPRVIYGISPDGRIRGIGVRATGTGPYEIRMTKGEPTDLLDKRKHTATRAQSYRQAEEQFANANLMTSVISPPNLPPSDAAVVESVGRSFNLDDTDISALTSYAVHPRTLASFDVDFAPVAQTAESQFEERDYLVSEMYNEWKPFLDMSKRSKRKVMAVLELGRLNRETYGHGRDPIVVTNNNQPGAQLSQLGETIELTDVEKSGYWATRRAMDRALGFLRDQMVRDHGLDPRATRTAARALAQIAPGMPQARKAELERLADMMQELQDMRRTGYVPFSRWGEYAVIVKDPSGAVVRYEQIEWTPNTRNLSTKAQAFARAAELRRQFPQYTVLAPTHISRAEGFDPVNLGMLDQLARMANLDRAAYDEMRNKLAEAQARMGFRAHLVPSRDIPGYSTDFERAIADYIMGMAGYLARKRYRPAWDNAIGAIPAWKGKLRAAAQTYRDYADTPREEFQALRQTGYLFYIAGVPATAIVNMTQPFLTTFPLLHTFTNTPRIMAEMTRAYADTTTMISLFRGGGFMGLVRPNEFFDPTKAPADVRAAITRAWEKGIMAPMTTMEMMGLARNRAEMLRKLDRRTREAIELVAHMFMTAERTNRIVTFMAAHRIASQPGMREKIMDTLRDNALAQLAFNEAEDFAGAFAEWMVDETQFRTGKVNRSVLQRGAGTAIFQFKDYAWQMIELYARTAALAGPRGKVAFALMMIMIASAAGLWGLPFADNLRTLIEYLLKELYDKDIDLRVELREAVGDMTGSTRMAEMASRGVFRWWDGSPEVGMRIGLGDIAPTTWQEALGIPFDLTWKRSHKAWDWARRGEVGLAAAQAMPNFVKNWLEAESWAENGIRSQTSGAKLVHEKELTPGEIWMKRFGARSRRIAEEMEAENAKSRADHAMDEMRRTYYYRIGVNMARAAAARRVGDFNAELDAERKIAQAWAEIEQYNEARPLHERIIINPNALRQFVTKELVGPELKDYRGPLQMRPRRQEIDQIYGTQ